MIKNIIGSCFNLERKRKRTQRKPNKLLGYSLSGIILDYESKQKRENRHENTKTKK